MEREAREVRCGGVGVIAGADGQAGRQTDRQTDRQGERGKGAEAAMQMVKLYGWGFAEAGWVQSMGCRAGTACYCCCCIRRPQELLLQSVWLQLGATGSHLHTSAARSAASAAKTVLAASIIFGISHGTLPSESGTAESIRSTNPSTKPRIVDDPPLQQLKDSVHVGT